MKHFYCRIFSLNALYNTVQGGDEVYANADCKQVFSTNERFNQPENAKVKVNCVVKLNDLGESLTLELFECDSLSNRKIGTFVLNTESVGGPYVTDINFQGEDYAKYSIEWELFQKQVI